VSPEFLALLNESLQNIDLHIIAVKENVDLRFAAQIYRLEMKLEREEITAVASLVCAQNQNTFQNSCG